MSKLTKYIMISLVICIFAGFIIYVIGYISFAGAFDKKYTREELTQNFVEHEKEFLDVVTFFKSKIPQKNNYSVSFWQKGNSVTLYLFPDIVSPENKIIGASDVKVDSPELDSALQILGWSKETLKLLSDKLEKTNCNYIRNVEYNDNIVDLSLHQSGWGSFSYRVWDSAIIDSLISIRGNPLGKDSFAVKVVLNYTSAL